MARTIEIDATVKLNDPNVSAAISLAQHLYDAVPLVKVELNQLGPGGPPGPPGPPNPDEFEYKITAVDGRVWTQVITFAGWPTPDIDPPMTFDVPDGWRRLAEFTHHRELRNHLITMINEDGLTRLEITWS